MKFVENPTALLMKAFPCENDYRKLGMLKFDPILLQRHYRVHV